MEGGGEEEYVVGYCWIWFEIVVFVNVLKVREEEVYDVVFKSVVGIVGDKWENIFKFCCSYGVICLGV